MAKFYLRISILISFIIACILVITYCSSYIPSGHNTLVDDEISSSRLEATRTLVVYVYAKTHALAHQNLQFFIRTAVRQTHDADYYFILQQIDNTLLDETLLPRLPSNAHYIQHENKCFDIGTIGWFLASGRVEKTKYKYFIFLNSSVRGPFIVSYYDNPIWYTIFTRRLNNETKLVGCTINCEQSPHVQSYLWAMDLYSLNLLLQNNTIFRCHKSKNEAIDNAEIIASKILLRSGFGIDSLMRKHQGVDFRLNANRNCNDIRIPTFNKNVDGISLDPFEVVFVKIKDQMAEYEDNRQRVKAYEKWIASK